MELVAELREQGFTQQEAIDEAKERLGMAYGGRIGLRQGTPEEGIGSLDAGASNITYKGNEGPKSPQQMAFDDTPGFEIESLKDLMDEFYIDNGREPLSIDELRRHFYIKYGKDRISKIDKIISNKQMASGPVLPSDEDPINPFAPKPTGPVLPEKMEMASGTDYVDMYSRYAQEIIQAGGTPMSIENFIAIIKEQERTKEAKGGRIGFQTGGISETRTLPPEFIEALGKTYAADLTRQAGIPSITTAVAQQPGETADQFAQRQAQAQQFGITQAGMAALKPEVAAQDPYQAAAYAQATDAW